MNYIIIPAREGSKGFPGKNRILFPYMVKLLTAFNTDPNYSIIVTTDDKEIMDMAHKEDYTVIERPSWLATDQATMRDVLIHVMADLDLNTQDKIIMLYLTYPERTAEDVKNAVDIYETRKGSSLLCQESINEHPYLMCYAKRGLKGKQVTKHNEYRRQDYPDVFRISHYIFICEAENLFQLNHNLYDVNTIYMNIENKIDIDTEGDYEQFKSTCNPDG